MKRFFSIVATLSLLAVVGCKEKSNEVDVPMAAEFALDSTQVTAPAEGGDFEVSYTVTNPATGAVVLTECKENWITGLSTATEGKICFTVAPNYKKEARSARIAVQYTAVAEKFEIAVVQSESTAELFAYEVVEAAPTTLTINITPADAKSAYICRLYTQAHIDAFGLDTDSALTYYDLDAIGDEATAAGQTLLNYLQNISHLGKSNNVMFDELVPNTDYVVYSYYVNLDNGSAASSVYRQVIRTAQTPKIDETITMSFAVSGASINQTVTTTNPETYYYTECWSTRDFKSYFGEEATPEQIFPNRWNEQVAIKLSSGYQPITIIETLCHQGTQTIPYTDLRANMEYIFYVFAVSPETAFTATDVVIERVRTESISQSDMTIDIRVEDIYATTANVYWTASDPHGKFARSVFTKSDFEALGADDGEKFATIFEKYDFYQAVGSTDMNLYNLLPNTDYVAFAYGLDGNEPNTRIFTTEFRTKSDTPGMSDIKVSWSEHYNMFELSMSHYDYWGDYADYYEYALLPLTISGVSTSDTIYLMVTTLPLEWYSTDAEWLRDVTNSKYLTNTYSNYNFMAQYEKEYSVIAVAQDSKGNYGKVFKGEFILYESDSSDTSNYVYVENK